MLNNIYKIEQIKEILPELYDDLVFFFNEIKMDINNVKNINISNLNFIINYYKLLYSYDFNIVKQYFIYLFLRKMGDYIDTTSIELLFNFYGRVLSGIVENKIPLKRTIETLDSTIGMLIGKMFVNEFFNKESKNKVAEIIKLIKNQLKVKIKTNDWMESLTKIKALEKLKLMNYKIGYPDKWPSYIDLEILDSNTFFQNILNCYKYNYMKEIKELYKKVNKDLWLMNPHDINAYYSPSHNEIVLPCGILQEPFFSIKSSLVNNIAGIGFVIGHEIIHGFDDMGRLYNGFGNIENWWTENDIIKYKQKTDILKKLFDELKIHDVFINGELTLGENIADLGGVTLAFNALDYYYKHNKIEFSIDDYKNFFYSYARLWKCKIRKEDAIKRAIIDPHAPPCYRVNMVLSNMNEFYKYFNIKQDSPMWIDPRKRASIW